MPEARIYNVDCMEGMASLEAHSLDCIICDLPYGVLNKQNPHAHWDTELPLEELLGTLSQTDKAKRGNYIVLPGNVYRTTDVKQS